MVLHKYPLIISHNNSLVLHKAQAVRQLSARKEGQVI